MIRPDCTHWHPNGVTSTAGTSDWEKTSTLEIQTATIILLSFFKRTIWLNLFLFKLFFYLKYLYYNLGSSYCTDLIAFFFVVVFLLSALKPFLLSRILTAAGSGASQSYFSACAIFRVLRRPSEHISDFPFLQSLSRFYRLLIAPSSCDPSLAWMSKKINLFRERTLSISTGRPWAVISSNQTLIWSTNFYLRGQQWD